MFETAELGRSVSKQDYSQRAPQLRAQLLEAQARLRKADFPVLVLFGGVDGAGKSETANLLNEWMDPRRIVTHAFDQPSQEESERPEFWRYWSGLPRTGSVGIFLSAWYHRPLVERVHCEITAEQFDDDLDRIISLERTLADGGALIQKFWLHLGKTQQEERFRALEADPLQSWRVTEKDWKHWQRYEEFAVASERLISKTSTGFAPWAIVEGSDERYRSLQVGTVLLEAMERRLDRYDRKLALAKSSGSTRKSAAKESKKEDDSDTEGSDGRDVAGGVQAEPGSILDQLDLTLKIGKSKYGRKLEKLRGRLNRLQRIAKERGKSTILVFEGWDAGGKGGAIRRLTSALEATDYQVISIAAPTDEERQRHYLWRFWRHLSRAGRFTIFDRSWYGRVLVERVEGFATETEWRRSYAEINDFEHQLVEHGTTLAKFWIHISPDEQKRRFEARQKVKYKRWKLTDEDWRNREKWDAYEAAVHDMVERTSTPVARWHLIEGEDKKFARIRVMETVCQELERSLQVPPPDDEEVITDNEQEAEGAPHEAIRQPMDEQPRS